MHSCKWETVNGQTDRQVYIKAEESLTNKTNV